MDHKTNKIENECPEFMDVLPQWQQTRAAIAGANKSGNSWEG